MVKLVKRRNSLIIRRNDVYNLFMRYSFMKLLIDYLYNLRFINRVLKRYAKRNTLKKHWVINIPIVIEEEE